MFRKIVFITLVIASFSTLVFAENYAVLITGDNPDGDASGTKTWNGGSADPDGYDEFWNDTFLMWEMLFCSGWDDENIFVLFANGEDTSYENERYRPDLLYGYAPWYIDHITDDSAYKQDVIDVFDHLDTTMTEDDFLFVWTFGHGSNEDPIGLVLMDAVLSIEDFDTLMPNNYNRRVFWMQQCYSGGFIEYLENDSTVILTAVDSIQIGVPADNLAPDAADTLENDLDSLDEYTHGEFNYHVLNAARLLTVGYFHSLEDSVDLNSDGLASMEEIWLWEEAKDSPVTTTPQLSDPDSIADVYLADLRYSDNEKAIKYSGAEDYVELSRAAVEEMFRQVGPFRGSAGSSDFGGLIIRILVLPDDFAGVWETLCFIALELSPKIPISLMSQYRPLHRASEYPNLNRCITEIEYGEALRMAEELGFETIYTQELNPEKHLTPDFNRKGDPFKKGA